MDAPIAFLVGFVVGMGFGAMAILYPEYDVSEEDEDAFDDDES